jgi:hypothetical protein
MPSAMKSVLCWLALVMVLLLSGCGVQIEVAPTAVPTPFPHPVPFSGFGANPIVRGVATPRIVFSGNAQAQVFMAPTIPDVYLIKGRQVQLTVDYDATWFEGSQGQGHIRFAVFVRTAQGWTVYDSAEKTLSTAAAPSNHHDVLSVVLASDTPGSVDIRAEVAVTANNNAGESKQAGEAVFRTITLNDPGNIKPDFAAMKPALGELDPSVVLADWRGWRNGPCALAAVAAGDPSLADVQVSCQATIGNNLEQAIKSVAAALTKARNPELLAHLNDMLGLVTFAQKNFAEADLHFSNAMSAWESAGRAWEMTVSMHNLACVRVMRGDGASAFTLFVQLHELHTQYGDEAGQMLTQANLGLVSADKNTLQQVRAYFQANGLPQLGVVDAWLQQLEKKP